MNSKWAIALRQSPSPSVENAIGATEASIHFVRMVLEELLASAPNMMGRSLHTFTLNTPEKCCSNFLVLWEVEMKGVLGYYDEFDLVIDFLHKKKINTQVLISDRISLDGVVARGFERLLSSQDLVKI